MATAISQDEQSLDALLEETPFFGYSYSYPHKTAYRPIEPAIPLGDVWSLEDRQSLFLYVHLPFCEFRCGFCNLFTISQPQAELPRIYLDAVRRQARSVRSALGEARFARLALGGGTPTFLSETELAELFAMVTEEMGAEGRNIPVSVEASPATVNAAKLALLRGFGVDRLSLGVQSFSPRDAHAMGRPQQTAAVERALTEIRAAGFPTLNIDLIYGGQGQTLASWLDSVHRALQYAPEELYLYPLYVRPQTGLGHLERSWDDWRIDAYRAARALLLDRGYEQVSLRMFRAPRAPAADGPVYCCQEDGMVGLGCGARSYTRALHYGREYAVRAASIRGIVDDFVRRDADAFGVADYGIELDDEDQRRRYLIVSLLQAVGISRGDYRARFGADPLDDFCQLHLLEARGLATSGGDRVRLTPAGLERSDVIGPWLYSRKVRALMEGFQWR